MSFERFDIYFQGAIMRGEEPEAVKRRVGALFKLQGERLERLFSGQPVAIKRGIDMDQAIQYRVTFRNAGALVEIRPALAAAGSGGTAATDDGNLSVSDARGFDLSDCAPQVTPQPIPDISGLALERPGATIDESPPAPAREIDTEGLTLAPDGGRLDESPPPAPPQIDTHELTLNPANQGSLAEFQKPVSPAPLPSTEHLELADEAPGGRGRARFPTSED